MMRQFLNTAEEESLLLKNFNNRDSAAFGHVYTVFYTELHYFAANLYRNVEIEPADAVQDAFMKLWQQNNLIFEKLVNIKAYLYVSIRNHYRGYLVHCQSVDKYKKIQQADNAYFEIDIIETEVITTLQEHLHLLPHESAEILTLLLEGWNADEVAQKLGRTRQTIYNKKHEAITLLRKNLAKNKILLIFLLSKMTF